MRYTLLAGKIHRATVTDTDLEYEGSITIDKDLLEAARIPLYSQVQIYNVTNGERLETYAILGERGSGTIALNGAAAHKANTGDIIIAAYCHVSSKDVLSHKPSLVYVDADNAIKETKLG